MSINQFHNFYLYAFSLLEILQKHLYIVTFVVFSLSEQIAVMLCKKTWWIKIFRCPLSFLQNTLILKYSRLSLIGTLLIRTICFSEPILTSNNRIFIRIYYCLSKPKLRSLRAPINETLLYSEINSCTIKHDTINSFIYFQAHKIYFSRRWTWFWASKKQNANKTQSIKYRANRITVALTRKCYQHIQWINKKSYQ